MGIYYDKYEREGALHWKAYRHQDGSYHRLVDDSLKPFDEVKAGTVLDIGCGDGMSAHLLCEKGFKITGVDYNAQGFYFFKEHSKHARNCELIVSDVFDYVPKKKFDYLYSLNTIEHLDNPAEICRLMKSIKKFGVVVTDDAEKTRSSRYHTSDFTKERFEELFKDFILESIELRHPQFFGYKIFNI